MGPTENPTAHPENQEAGRKQLRTPAADAALSAERLRGALSSSAGAPALLQRALPGGGAEMVAVEGATTIPGDGTGQTATERPKPALPGARPKAGNHQSQRQLTTPRG
jgi:hypothetical protein